MENTEQKRQAVQQARLVFGLMSSAADFSLGMAQMTNPNMIVGQHPADALKAVSAAVLGLTAGYDKASDAQLDFMLGVINRAAESMKPAEA